MDRDNITRTVAKDPWVRGARMPLEQKPVNVRCNLDPSQTFYCKATVGTQLVGSNAALPAPPSLTSK